MTPLSPLAAIRAATRDLHARLDGGAFAQAVRKGTLPVARYESFLRAVHSVLLAVEECVELSGSGALQDAYAHGCTRRGRLARDLQYLRADMNHVDAAVLHALVLSQQLRRDAQHGEAAVFGHLYVLEGSQLGGLLLCNALAQRPELQHGGLTYLSGAADETRAQFQAFLAKLEAQLPDEASIASAVTGATHAFEGFAAIVAAVMSADLAGPWLTAPLNVEAGTHAIPRDVREVQAALSAGEQSFRRWSYYGARYGERGLRFTRSDSCWLVTLARHEGDAALRHLRWLARVLAARGMPTLLLEQHLELLH
ncbi:MAG TPA: biliverdin-producing heme oxygenase, partial [Polyangiales bacterium]